MGAGGVADAVIPIAGVVRDVANDLVLERMGKGRLADLPGKARPLLCPYPE